MRVELHASDIDTVTAGRNFVALAGWGQSFRIEGSPAELLTLAERIRDAVHAAELAQMTAEQR